MNNPAALARPPAGSWSSAAASLRGLGAFWVGGLALLAALVPPAAAFTRLVPLPPPRITAATDAVVLTGSNPVENLIDGNPKTEYASAGRGVLTFVEFDFGAPRKLAGFRHQDRKNGTIAGSELVLFDEAGREVRRVAITHPDRSGAVTFQPIWPAISARRARWQVTKLGFGNAGTVGGAEIAFYGVGAAEPRPAAIGFDVVALPLARRSDAPLRQPVRVTIDYPYAEPIEVRLQFGTEPPRALRLRPGPQTEEFLVPVARQDRPLAVSVAEPTSTVLARADFTIPAFRELTIHVLPHSHVDIGYTEIQPAIEEKQLNNLLTAMDAAERTADYPAGARFVWNLEGLWPADLLLRRLDAAQRARFIAAVQQGRVALNGMYFNTLTGLCRPEELTRLFRFGTELRALTGTPVEAAMISDVPGYTWGTVTAMAQAGIRYFCAAPNIFDRIGDTYVQWENKPFWWVGPSGRERVLVWVPFGGYNLAARIGRITPEWVAGFGEELVRSGFRYDVVYMRWSRGDNAAPDASVSDQVREWNATFAWPRFVISSARDAFHALEQKHGAQLPEFRGDWTPYWEDGAGSSAAETALNRGSSDRLAQAEALWALRQPASYPAREFNDAMREILLYDEHTWGAAGSVSAPRSAQTIEQWTIKSSHAAAADDRSRDLLLRALALGAADDVGVAAVDVINTNSWARSGVVVLSKALSAEGDLVRDEHGAGVPAQRLTTGELAVFGRDIPPYAARRYTITKGEPARLAAVAVDGVSLDNGLVKAVLDPQTGAVVELRAKGGANLAGPGAAGLNAYLYFNGDDPARVRSNEPVTVRVKEKGPLIASLVAESDAPGCHRLSREVRLVAGEDWIELANTVDKARLVANSYREPAGKESVNFGFPFAVPEGQVRLEVPYAVIEPDRDQIPGACKNWFTINRWADVSNRDYGVTWVSLDAPLVQVGGLTANLLNSQTNPAVWRKQVGPTQQLCAWVMNNHWGTNYRAFQEGPTTFRFLLRPHRGYDPAAAAKLAIGASQPLVARRARGPRPDDAPRLTVAAPEVIVTGLKPSDDGRALIVRLWNATGRAVQSAVRWASPAPRRVALSDTGEQPGAPVNGPLALPPWGTVTLRAELP